MCSLKSFVSLLILCCVISTPVEGIGVLNDLGGKNVPFSGENFRGCATPMVESYSDRIRGFGSDENEAGVSSEPLACTPCSLKERKGLELGSKIDGISYDLENLAVAMERPTVNEKICNEIGARENVYYVENNCDSRYFTHKNGKIQPNDLICFYPVHCQSQEFNANDLKTHNELKALETEVKFNLLSFIPVIFSLLAISVSVLFLSVIKIGSKGKDFTVRDRFSYFNESKDGINPSLIPDSNAQPNICPIYRIEGGQQTELNSTDENNSESNPGNETASNQSDSQRQNVLNQLSGENQKCGENQNSVLHSFLWQKNWTLILMRFLHWLGTIYAYVSLFVVRVFSVYIETALDTDISETLSFKTAFIQETSSNLPNQSHSENPPHPQNAEHNLIKTSETTSSAKLGPRKINRDRTQHENSENHRRNAAKNKPNTRVTSTISYTESVELKLLAPPVYNTSFGNTDQWSNLSTYRVTVPQGNTKDEAFRFSTFQHFPNFIQINKSMYARGGFYYCGERDGVICFACSASKFNLELSDDPFSLSMHNPSCRFAQRLSDCGNIPVSRTPVPAGQLFQSPGNVDIHLNRNGTNIQITSNQRQNNVQRPTNTIQRPTNTIQRPTNTIQRPNNAVNYQTARPVVPRTAEEVPFERQLANVIDPTHEVFLKSLDLRNEIHRHQTFAAWPNSPPTPAAHDMAGAGWFYLGNLDRSQCFSCGGVLRNWRVYDNPLTEHKKHFPNCKMAQGREHRNIPDRNSPSYNPPRHQRNMPRPQRAQNFPLNDQQRSELRDLFPCLYANSPHMESHQSRLNTFSDWNYTDASVNEISAAGFYYLGNRDRVKCWYCNGGLQNWDYNDEPWAEHAKWYPTCEFLLRNKGTDFVHSITNRYPNLHRPRLRTPGQDVPPSGMTGPSPPVPIVDPQDQMRKEAQALDKALKSEVAKSVLGMGFDEVSVREVMRSQIEDNSAPYQSASALLEAVLAHEASQSSETPPTTSSFTPAPLFSASDPPLFTAPNSDPLFTQNAPLFTQNNPLFTQNTPLFTQNTPLFTQNAPLFTQNTPLFTQNAPLFTPSTDPTSISFLPPPSYSNLSSLQSFPTSSFEQIPMSFGTDPPKPDRDIIDSFPTGGSLQPRGGAGEAMDTDENAVSGGNSDVGMATEPTQNLVTTSIMTSQRITISQSQSSEPKLLESSQNNNSSEAEPSEEEKRKLKKRLQELKDELLCKVCLDQKADMVFIPCGHICCCMNCTKALRHCPICRKKIQRAVKTYTS